ncbi:hypothetical protein ACYJ1Y_16130 [Natrialbaceae archaeon A-gly3]
MGLFDSIRDKLASSNESDGKDVKTGGESEQSAGVDAEISFNMTPPKGSIDLEYLQQIIEDYYDVPESDAGIVAECIEEGHFEGYGYDKIARNARDAGADLDRERSMEIVWTELGGVQTRRNIAKAHKRINESDFVAGVEWSVPNDERGCSPVCEAAAEEIADRGGSVSVPELKTILTEKAEKYDDGTPERMDDWIPHKECRTTPIEVMD